MARFGLTLLLLLGAHSATISGLCFISWTTKFIDCSWLNLTQVPRFKGVDFATTLSLRNNFIRKLNLTALFRDLPNLQAVILYENPMRCVRQCQLARKIILKSHCYCPLSTTFLMSSTTSTTERDYTQPKNFTTSHVTTTLAITGYRKTTMDMYIILVVASLLVILLGSLIFVCIYKRCRHRPRGGLNMEMVIVQSHDEEGEREGEEEELIFSRIKSD